MSKGVGKVISNPVTELLSDVAATVIPGGAPFIPLINAAETAGGDALEGDSIGKSLGQGALSGGEALAGQELAGAFGVGTGNDFFNSTLGITGDNPAGTGLPDIGSGISNMLGSGSSAAPTAGTGGASIGAAAPLNADSSDIINQAVGQPSSTSPILNTSAIDNAGSSAINNFSNPGAGGAAGTVNLANTPSPGVMNQIGSALGLGGSTGSTLGSIAKYALPTAAIGSNLISQFKTPKGENELLTAGSSALNAGQGLINTLQSGQLPPGEQSVINQGLQDATNAIKAKYASLGLSGSTMEQQALQAAQQDAQTQATNYATQATQTGLQAVGATGSIYSNIMNSILGQNNTLTSALAKLGGAATGTGTNNTAAAST